MTGFWPRPGPWTTVAEALRAHTVAELELIARVAGVRSEGRKEARIAELCRVLEGERLRFSFARLSSSQKAAVAMAVHAWDGRLSVEGFRLAYGETPDFGRRRGCSRDLEEPSLLCLFVYGDRVPRDLLVRLRELVPKPEVSVLRSWEAPPEFAEVTVPSYLGPPARRRQVAVRVVERQEAAAAELASVLRLVQSRSLEVTAKKREPTRRLMRRVKKVFEGGADFLDLIPSAAEEHGEREALDFGEIRAFAWPRLVLAGRLARTRGQTMVLSSEGGAALDGADAQVLKNLWQGWLDHGEPDELRRISGLEGASSPKAELTPPPERRRAIAAALSDCPVGRWVSVHTFFDHIRVSGRDFEVSSALHELRVKTYSSIRMLNWWDGPSVWMALQARVVLCLLFEYAATLGLLDVAYSSPLYALTDEDGPSWVSRYDGLRAFRVTDLGGDCLGSGDDGLQRSLGTSRVPPARIARASRCL